MSSVIQHVNQFKIAYNGRQLSLAIRAITSFHIMSLCNNMPYARLRIIHIHNFYIILPIKALIIYCSCCLAIKISAQFILL